MTLYGISLHYIKGTVMSPYIPYNNNKIPDCIYLILTPPQQQQQQHKQQ